MYVLLIPLCSALLGHFIVKKKIVSIAWLLFIIDTLLVERVTTEINPVLRMLAIIASLFVSMKIITATESHKNTGKQLKLYQWLLFVFGWVGMRSELFQTVGGPPLEKYKEMIIVGTSRIALGSALIFLAHKLFLPENTSFIIVATALAMIGLSLILHFGILAINAGIWRYFGVRTYYLFNSPLKSTSLSEFWSKRWNIAFSEMTSLAVYRPLKKKIGIKNAFFLAFLFSGLLHEMAISLPVNKGFGLPLAYFAIQAAVMITEDFLSKRNITFFRNSNIARLWVYFWVIVPAPILFHSYFIKGIIWPLSGLH
jgi:hypothetical protein